MNTPQKPVHEIRLGVVRAAIWRNELENGVRFNASFSRIYRDGDQWKHTESFGRDDLLVLAKVADEAHSWIFAQVRETGAGPGGGTGGGGSAAGPAGRAGGFAGAAASSAAARSR